MMTTLVPFQPSPIAPFQFQLELDSQEYNAVVTWNVYGQRWYVNIYASDNSLVLAIPRIGSPLPLPLAVNFGNEGGSFRLLAIDGGAIYNLFGMNVEAPNALRFTETTIIVPPGPLPLASLSWSSGIVLATAAAPFDLLVGSVVPLTISGAVPAGYNGDFDCTVVSNTSFAYPVPSDPGTETTPGVFYPTGPTTAITWNAGTVTATTAFPLLYPLGSIVVLTIAGVTPSGFNGRFPCVITGKYSFTYPLETDPGVPPSVRGTYSPDISLTAGYFDSTLIWRPATGNFEISP